MDFTLKKYYALLDNFTNMGNIFFPLAAFLESNSIDICLIFRHDVDRKPENSLKIAQIENSLGIKGSYYFRIVPESFDIEIIKQIEDLGHEIGYHYEDVDLVSNKLKGKRQKFTKEELIDLAYESFCENLKVMREVADIKTICMHGSPRSKYDNKLIWEKYNYKELGLVGEPYFDIDFDQFAYFTDTGRRWNGYRYSIRDKVQSNYSFDFKTTNEIIKNIDLLPPKIMFTIHPERWNDSIVSWTKELIFQNSKNLVKRMLIRFRS